MRERLKNTTILLVTVVAGDSVGVGTVAANGFLTVKRITELFRIAPVLLQREVEHGVVRMAGHFFHDVEEFR